VTSLNRRTGKLLKGGEPDLNTCAKMVLSDWQRGKIPFFEPPPFDEDHPPRPPALTDEGIYHYETLRKGRA